MREARLKTRILVQAAVRLCTQQAIPIAIARRGDDEAGAILIKLNRRDGGFTVLAQTRSPSGELGWFRGTGDEPVDEAAADTYVARQVARDPDLWVVEIESGSMEPVIDGRTV